MMRSEQPAVAIIGHQLKIMDKVNDKMDMLLFSSEDFDLFQEKQIGKESDSVSMIPILTH